MTSSVNKRLLLGLAVPASIVAVVSLLLLLRRGRHRRQLLQVATAESTRKRDKRKCDYKSVAMASADAAPVVATDAEFAARWPDFQARARQFGYCGLDCEWRWQAKELDGGPGPLALVQVATPDGCVLLVRVQQLTLVPTQLEQFLADASVLKFGVGIDGDADKLANDLGCPVSGCVDLRHLVDSLPHAVVCGLPRRGLKPLARDLLGVDYTSRRWVARTDWELPLLAPHQVQYAALDALVGAMIPGEILALKLEHSSDPECLSAAAAQLTVARMSAALVDLKYTCTAPKKRPPCDVTRQPVHPLEAATILQPVQAKLEKQGKFARQNPLYHNCQMLAPDGQLMCTLDRRKADWYTERGLATVIFTEPGVHAIKLNFEPSGRPTGDQEYYLTDKANMCVVCGSDQCLQRKKVIPDEYRRHFPELMKSHKSHDVLLLCGSCHVVSEGHTEQLRRTLAQEFGFNQEQPTAQPSEDQRRVRSCAKALLAHARGRAEIPAPRLTELRAQLRQLLAEEGDDAAEEAGGDFSVDRLEAVLASAEQDGAPASGGGVSGRLAGVIVRRALESGRLLEFELRWRRHFLESMRPRHLPSGWSVGHQHDRLGAALGQVADGGAVV